MAIADCIRFKSKITDEADKSSFEDNFKALVAGGVPPADAYTQAAELALETLVDERNELAVEINEAGGYLAQVTLENILNPDSYFKDSDPLFSRKEAGSITSPNSLEEVFKLAAGSVFSNMRQFKMLIQDRIKKLTRDFGLDPAARDDAALRHLIDTGVSDAVYALRENANAVGWYDVTVRKALAVLAELHPEIATDENAKFAFTYALAVTSNGHKVDKNFELAERVYRHYKEHGEMPTNLKAGQAQKAINDSLADFNSLSKKWGMDTLRQFMMTKFTVQELTTLGFEAKGELAETEVYGAQILGPKIGNGFFANLNGEFDQLTIDRWLTRTWGRWTGTLIEEKDDLILDARDELSKLVSRLVKKGNKATKDRFEQLTGVDLSGGYVDLDVFAAAIEKASTVESDREIMNKTNLGNDLRLVGNRLAKHLDGQKEAPDNGGERAWMRQVFSGILEKMHGLGYTELTMADLQALLWYPEKRLYDSSKLKEDVSTESYADDEAPDYANAAAKLAKDNGVPQAKIDEALSNESNRPTARVRPEAEADQSRRDRGQEDGAGFTEKEKRGFIRTTILQNLRNFYARKRGRDRQYGPTNTGPYARTRGTAGKELRVHVKQEYSPAAKARNNFKVAGLPSVKFYELTGTPEAAAFFREKISAAKASNGAIGAAVDVYDSYEIEGIRLFVTANGMAGFAIKPDGDFVSVFNHSGNTERGVVPSMLLLATQQGAIKLDAFDTQLPHLYSQYGFKVVSRTPFNEEVAKEFMPDWDYNHPDIKIFNNGRPDVVFMVFDPTNDNLYQVGEGDLYTSYDAAADAQAEAVDTAPIFKRGGAYNERGTLDGTETNNSRTLKEALEAYLDGDEQAEVTEAQLPIPIPIIEALEKLFGKRIVGVKLSDNVDFFDGVYIPQNSDAIYVNVNSGQPHLAVIGHEMLHAMKRDNPKLYAELRRVMLPLLRNVDRYKAELDKAIATENGGEASMALTVEEIIADALGDNIANEDFWKALAGERSSTYKQIIDYVRKFISKVKAAINPLGHDQYVTDVEKVQTILANAVRLHARVRLGGKAGQRAVKEAAARFKRAYHGSPHKFVVFDHSHMGSGEGAQAYGWGTYLADSLDVAGAYMPKFYDDQEHLMRLYDDAVDKQQYNRAAVLESAMLHETPGAMRMRFLSGDEYPESAIPEFEAAIKEVEELSGGGGYLYEVELDDALIDRMLDWDAPLSEQPESVLTAYKQLPREVRERIPLNDYAGNPITGGNFYNSLSDYFRAGRPDNIFDGGTGQLGQFDASAELKSLGIPGIKYLDGNSRADGVGTRNYVVFDEKDMTIISRNGEKFSRKGYTQGNEQNDTTSTGSVRQADRTGSQDSAAGDPYAEAAGRDTEQGVAEWERAKNGETVTFVHRSFDPFTEFDDARLGQNTGAKTAKLGHFLAATDTHDVERYGTNVGVFSFQLQKPLIISSQEFYDLPDLGEAGIAAMRDALMASGYDGILVEGVHDVIIFEGKNLTNVPDNSDAWLEDQLLFRRRGLNPSGEATTETPSNLSVADELKQKFVDKFHTLAKVQKTLSNKTRDAKRATVLYSGRARARLEDFEEDVAMPLANAVKATGKSFEEVGRFLHARHAEEANRTLKRRNPDRADNDALSGMTDKEAKRILAKYRNDTRMQRIAKAVDRMNRDRLKIMVEDGILSQSEANTWQRLYPNYVPLHREDMDGHLPTHGQGFDSRKKPSKTRVGSAREVDHKNLIARLVAQSEHAMVAGEKNRVAQEMYYMALDNPNEELWSVTDLPQSPYLKADGTAGFRPNAMDGNVLMARIDGKTRFVWFNPDNEHATRIARAMKNLDDGGQNVLTGALLTINRYLSSINTSLSPEFIISNFFRDLQTAGYNLTDTEVKDMELKTMARAPKAINAIRSVLRGDGSHELAEDFKAFRRAGGMTGWVQHYDSVDDKMRSIERSLRWETTPGLKQVKATMKAIEDYNVMIENGVRLSTFISAREKGLTDAQAAKVAKQVTVDFNQKGEWGTVLNAMYLFYNASIQGTARLLRAAFDPKNKKIRVLLGSTVAFATALDMLNRSLAAPEDEDEPNPYDQIPDHIKDRNLILWDLTGTTENGYFKIPLPWGYNLFHVIGQETGRAVDAARGEVPEWGALPASLRLTNAALSAFNPVQDGTLLQTLTPTVLDPALRVETNTDWHGGPLYPDYNKSDPNYTKFYRNAREGSKEMAAWLNEATMDPETRKAWADVSPEWIDMMIDFTTGSFGRVVVDTGQFISNVSDRTPMEWNQIPMARKVVGEVGESAQRADFYEAFYEVIDINTDLSRVKREQGVQRWREARDAVGKRSALLAFAKTTQKRLRAVRTQLKDAQRKGDEARLERLQTREKQIMDRFMSRYRKVMYQ